MALPSAIVFMVVSSTSLLSILGFAKYINVDAAQKGLAMSPVHKLVNANPPRRTWNEFSSSILPPKSTHFLLLSPAQNSNRNCD